MNRPEHKPPVVCLYIVKFPIVIQALAAKYGSTWTDSLPICGFVLDHEWSRAKHDHLIDKSPNYTTATCQLLSFYLLNGNLMIKSLFLALLVCFHELGQYSQL